MRKSIFFWEIRHLSGVADGAYDEVFAALKRIGIEGFQLSARDIGKIGEEELRNAMSRHGMCADIIHTAIPLLSADDGVFRDAIRSAEETVALLHRFSCKRLMIVALPVTDVNGEGDRERAMARMIEGLTEIVKIAQAEGIEVYIENFSKPLLPYTAVSDIVRILDAVPALKYTFDVGNFICVGVDPFEAYTQLQSRVSALHLKNFTPTADEGGIPCADGHRVEGVAFDRGEFDMPAFLRRATTDGGRILPVIEHNAALPMSDIERSAALVDRLLNI
jgi:sugar phosphate isomerase/epimerase